MFSFFTSRSIANRILPLVFIWATIKRSQFVFMLFLLGASPALAELTSERHFYTKMPFVPLTLNLVNTNLPLVTVRINDTQNATFLIDTGSSFIYVSSHFAQQTALPELHLAPSVAAPLYRGKPMKLVTLGHLQMNNLDGNNQSAIVLPPGSLGPLEGRVDGVLGIAFLSRFALVFDYANRQFLMFAPGRLSTKERQEFGFGDSRAIPMTSSPSGFWSVDAIITNAEHRLRIPLRIDTGSGATVLPFSSRFTLNLKSIAENVEKWGFEATTKSDSAFVESIQIGDFSARNFALDCNSQLSDPAPATLGQDLLSRCLVLMDFPAGKIYIAAPRSIGLKVPAEPGTAPPAPAP